MFVDSISPEILSPQELDQHLANGWFRMGQDIFTTNFLKFNGGFYPAVWLRIDLNADEISSTQKKIFKQNKVLKTSIQPFKHSKYKEFLFRKYRKQLKFSPAPSLKDLLYHSHENTNSIFTTYEICVYHETQLIAVGIFDLGDKSAEGISCFYDHTYSKFSLGKYLMYLKMDYCKNLGYDYFYPGYFAPGYPLFDYKLDLRKNALEYFDFSRQEWHSFAEFRSEDTIYAIMDKSLTHLSELMQSYGIKALVKMYDLFDIELNDIFKGRNLFEYPLFLYIPRLNPFHVHLNIIIYNPITRQYQFYICSKAYQLSEDVLASDKDTEDANDPHFKDFILRPERLVYSADTAEEITGVIRTLLDENLLI